MASINLQGDTSGAITISAPSVAGSNTLTLPATTQTLATQNALGVRNLIINGDMKIAQRGTSTTALAWNNDNNFPSCDRWKFQHFGSSAYTAAFTGSQDTDVPSGQGFDYSMKLACTTADATLEADTAVLWSYQFEGQMLQHLAYGTSSAKTMTFSFWVKSNVTGVFNVELYQYDVDDAFSYEYTINTADTWEKKTITIPANTSNIITNDNTVGMSVRFNLALGSNYTGGTLPTGWQTRVLANTSPSMTNNIGSSTSNYINITGVQLEVGDTATPFEHRPYDMELARCQRYFCSSFNAGVAPANGVGNSIASLFAAYDNTTGWSPWIQFPVTMRVAPSMTAYRDNVAGTDGQWITYDSGYTSLTSTTLTTNGTTSGFYCNGSRSSAFAAHDSYLLRGNFTADAEL